ncbi:MAG: hypothetical protein ACKOFK_07480 [Betaproteobacteria bacterium]
MTPPSDPHTVLNKAGTAPSLALHHRMSPARARASTVHHPQTFTRVLAQGSLGLGDSYVEGWWDCAQLDGFFTRILRAGLDAEVGWRARAWPWLRARLCNLQSCVGTFRARSNQLWQVVLSPGGVDGGYRRVS